MTGQEASELLLKVYGDEVFKGGRSNGKALTTAILMGANALKVLEQFRGERDVAIAQLEELGLCLGQKVDHVKEAINKQIAMKPKEYLVNGSYNEQCPSCGSFAIDNYCIRCGQKIDWE